MSNVDRSKLDVLRVKLEERKTCEKKALDTCLQLIELDQVTDEMFIDAVNTTKQLCRTGRFRLVVRRVLSIKNVIVASTKIAR
jgi:hypothetical protein